MDERVARYESSLSVDDTESSMELMALRRDTKFEVSSGARRFMDRQNSTLASVEVEDNNDGKENKRKYTKAFSPEDWSEFLLCLTVLWPMNRDLSDLSLDTYSSGVPMYLLGASVYRRL